MTNTTPDTKFWEMQFGEPVQWLPNLAWLTTLLLVLWTVGTVLRWLFRKTKARDPSALAAGSVVQFSAFLLLNTNWALRYIFGSIQYGAPDSLMLFLAAAQILQQLLIVSLVGLGCVTLACLVARRLPRVPLHTLTPMAIAVADSVLSLLWLLWMCTLKR